MLLRVCLEDNGIHSSDGVPFLEKRKLQNEPEKRCERSP
jgi:hypothetical protein